MTTRAPNAWASQSCTTASAATCTGTFAPGRRQRRRWRRGSAAPRRGDEPGTAHLREAVLGPAPLRAGRSLMRGSRTSTGPTASPLGRRPGSATSRRSRSCSSENSGSSGRLGDKVATAFTSSQTEHGAQESTTLALNNTLWRRGRSSFHSGTSSARSSAVARALTARPSPSQTRGPGPCAASFARRPKRAPKPWSCSQLPDDPASARAISRSD